MCMLQTYLVLKISLSMAVVNTVSTIFAQPHLPILSVSTPWVKNIHFPKWKMGLIYRFQYVFCLWVQYILNFCNVWGAIHNLEQLVASNVEESHLNISVCSAGGLVPSWWNSEHAAGSGAFSSTGLLQHSDCKRHHFTTAWYLRNTIKIYSHALLNSEDSCWEMCCC